VEDGRAEGFNNEFDNEFTDFQGKYKLINFPFAENFEIC